MWNTVCTRLVMQIKLLVVVVVVVMTAYERDQVVGKDREGSALGSLPLLLASIFTTVCTGLPEKLLYLICYRNLCFPVSKGLEG